MNIFYKICVILIIIGGINWGLIGLFSFDAVAWLLGRQRKFALPRGIYRGWYRRAVRHSQPVRQRAAARRRNNAPRVFPLFRPSGAPRSQNAFSGGPSPRQRASAAVFCRSNFSESPSRAGFPVHIVRRALYRNPTFGI